MSKEMNWLYVKENYGKLFEQTFNKESEIIDIINLSFKEAKEMSYEELANRVCRLENEMAYISENKNAKLEDRMNLSMWCFNMIDNLNYVFNLRG